MIKFYCDLCTLEMPRDQRCYVCRTTNGETGFKWYLQIPDPEGRNHVCTQCEDGLEQAIG